MPQAGRQQRHINGNSRTRRERKRDRGGEEENHTQCTSALNIDVQRDSESYATDFKWETRESRLED